MRDYLDNIFCVHSSFPGTQYFSEVVDRIVGSKSNFHNAYSTDQIGTVLNLHFDYRRLALKLIYRHLVLIAS